MAFRKEGSARSNKSLLGLKRRDYNVLRNPLQVSSSYRTHILAI